MSSLIHPTEDPEVGNHSNDIELEVKRDGTAPDGQVLPDWMTWTEYDTSVDGVELRTWSIVQLPQTYYGASIPLGPGWAYGGGASPTSRGTLGNSGGSMSAATEDETVNGHVVQPSRTDSSINTQGNPSSVRVSTISTTSMMTSSTSPFSAPSTPSSTAPPLTTSPLASSFSNSQAASADSHTLLVPLLPAILVPLLALFIVASLLFWFWRRKRQRETTSSGSDPGLGWRPASLRRRHTGHAYVTAETSREENKPGAAPAVAEKSSQQPQFAPPPPPVIPTPTERSALLSEFVPHHHRHWSLPPRNPNGPPEEMDDELADLVSQNQTLLQRLTAGLVAISRSGSLTSANSTRKASGNMVERRGSGRYTLLGEDKTPSAIRGQNKEGSKRESGSQSGTGTGSAQADTSGTTSGPNGAMNDSQLFFRVPASSLSSSGPPSRGSHNSRGTSSRSGSGSTRDMRSSWYTSRYAQNLPPGAQSSHWFPDLSGDVQSYRRHEAIPENMSIGGASTEGTSDGDLGEFGRRTQSDGLRFPTPPSRPPRTPPQTAQALDRRDKSYTHAPLSPFGSLPTTPADSAESHLVQPLSSSDHSKPPTSTEDHQRLRQPTSSLSAARPSSTILSPDPPTLSPMANVFVATPPGSAGSGDRHRSYIGEPLVDMQRVAFAERPMRGVDEFGQSAAYRQVGTPDLIVPTGSNRRSQKGSLHSDTTIARK